jgi:outer membrane lipoprotein-sorting protein
MRLLTSTLLLILVAASSALASYKSGDEVIAAMYKKYSSTWYSTLTFQQATTNYKPDGTSTVSTWYEALSAPGKLRIDFTPLEKHDGALFTGYKVYSYRDGKLVGSRDLVHPLLVLGFDVYKQPVATTLSQLKGMGIDLSIVHEEPWQGKTAIVVGAKQGDLTTPQFWIDKKDLLFVRLIEKGGRDGKSIQDTEFNKYVKVKGGWVAAGVRFTVDGKLTTTEDYTNIKIGMTLDPDLWAPEKWATVDRSYIPQ